MQESPQKEAKPEAAPQVVEVTQRPRNLYEPFAGCITGAVQEVVAETTGHGVGPPEMSHEAGGVAKKPRDLFTINHVLKDSYAGKGVMVLLRCTSGVMS